MSTLKDICYQCGNVMVDEQYYQNNQSLFTHQPKFKHDEHIIQNALHGRLKSDSILCRECGSGFGLDVDKDFTSLFMPITERIKEILLSKDHGKNSVNNLRGVLYSDDSLQESKDVVIRSNIVSPKDPFYAFDKASNIVTIYANLNRGKQYRKIVEKELSDLGVDLKLVDFKYVEDIKSKGILGVFFTEGIEKFNEKFSLGFSKIALGFAMHCGVSRKQVPRTLEINSENHGKLIFTHNLIPFVSIGAVDKIIEINRPEVEDYYPSHTLILFSQKFERNIQHLYCYIDLFSTFQYYVLLNDNYKGSPIYKTYHQATTKQDLGVIDVNKVRIKYLDVIAEQYKVDKTKYHGTSIEEYIEFLDKEIRNYRFNPQLNLKEEVEKMLNRITPHFILAQSSSVAGSGEIIKTIRELHKPEVKAFTHEMHNYLNNESGAEYELFRTAFFEDDGNGGIEILPYAPACAEESTTDEIRRAYGHIKFNQISKFIDDTTEKSQSI